MAKKTNVLNDDNLRDIKEFKNCLDGSTLTEIETFIVVDDDPFACKGTDKWYKDKEDLSIEEWEPDSAAVNREDVEGDSIIHQTTATDITITRTITLKAKYRSNFNDRMATMWMNDSESGSEGRQLMAYCEGGFHMVRNYVYNSGTAEQFTIQVIDANLKITTLPNPLSGIYKSDTTMDFEANIERMPVYRIQGSIPAGYALPEDIEAPTIEVSSVVLTDTDLTLQVNMEDAGGVLDPEQPTPVGIEVYDIEGTRIAVSTVPISASEITVPIEIPQQEVSYIISYAISEATQILWYTGEAVQSEVLAG